MQNWAVGPPAETAAGFAGGQNKGGGTACRDCRWLRRRPKQGRWDRLPGLPLASPAAKTRALGPPAGIATGFAGGQNKGAGTACRDCHWLRRRPKQGRWDRLPGLPLASPAAKGRGGAIGNLRPKEAGGVHAV